MKVPFCDLERLHSPIMGELQDAFERVTKRARFVLGQEVDRFEEQWAAYCQRKYAVGVASGLDALTLLLRAHQIRPGDEVLVASNTFIGTWMAVSAVGATPVPVEPDYSMNMSAPLVEAAINTRTAAILTTHLYGNISDMYALRRVADFYSIPLLVDACQAHGAKGADLGDGAAFSFYPTKNLGCLGDGGAVVTDNGSIDAQIRDLRNYGGHEKDHHWTVGSNSRLDELQAAMLNVKLPYLEEWNRRRAHNSVIYAMVLGGDAAPVSVRHIFPILSDRRALLRGALAADGIQTMVHYPKAPSQQPCYQGKCPSQPRAERMSERLLSLPVGPELTGTEVEYVGTRVKRWIEQNCAKAAA